MGIIGAWRRNNREGLKELQNRITGIKISIMGPYTMQLAACNRITSCVLELVRVACSVKLLQEDRIVIYSLQHVARSFKGFTGNAATKHLSRRGDLHTL